MSTTVQTQAPAAVKRPVTPRYEIREHPESFILTAWLPGVDRSALETTVHEHTLTVSGRRNFTVPGEWTAVHREIPQSDFRLALELDNRVNHQGVTAELSQGVLTLTLPKAEAVKPRRIEIQG